MGQQLGTPGRMLSIKHHFTFNAFRHTQNIIFIDFFKGKEFSSLSALIFDSKDKNLIAVFFFLFTYLGKSRL